MIRKKRIIISLAILIICFGIVFYGFYKIKYSQDLNGYFVDKDSKRKLIVMGCYGIGSTRVMGAIAEVYHDDKGIIWPSEIAPFKAHLVPIGETGRVWKVADKLYQDLSSSAPSKWSFGGSTIASGEGGQKTGLEVLYDDRKDKMPGEKLRWLIAITAILLGMTILIRSIIM